MPITTDNLFTLIQQFVLIETFLYYSRKHLNLISNDLFSYKKRPEIVIIFV